MPQMAPMLWITLFGMFISMLIIINIIIFFNKNYLPKNNNVQKKNDVMEWKW